MFPHGEYVLLFLELKYSARISHGNAIETNTPLLHEALRLRARRHKLHLDQ